MPETKQAAVQASATPAVSRSLQTDSQLIEDYLLTDSILVDAGATAPLAVFTNNNGDSEALVVHMQDHQVYHVAREPRSPSGWNLIGLGSQITSLAAVDADTAWAVGSDGGIWRVQNGMWTQISDSLPGAVQAQTISVDYGGNPWVMGTDLNLYQYQGQGQWQQAQQGQYLAPPCGFPGSLWTFSQATSQVLTNAGGEWQVGAPAVPSGDLPSTVVALEVDLDGNVWITDQSSNLYRLVNGQWQQAPSVADLYSVAVVSPDAMWGMVGNNDVYLLNQWVNGQWHAVAGAPAMSLYGSISVGRDGSLWLIDASGHACSYPATSSTFEQQMMPSGMCSSTQAWSILEVATGRDAGGTQHAFFVGNSALYISTQSSDGGWPLPQQVTWEGTDDAVQCSNIGVTNQQSDNALIVYGGNPDGSLVIVRWDGSAYTGTSYAVQPTSNLNGCKIQISAIDSDQWWTFAVQDGLVRCSCGPASNPLEASDSTENMGSLSAIALNDNGDMQSSMSHVVNLPVVGTQGTAYVAALDTSGNLWMVTNVKDGMMFATGNYQQLTNFQGCPLGAVGMAAGVVQSNGSIRLYACENSSSGVNRLWVLRQIGTAVSGGNFQWTNWHPLGGDYLLLANGPGSRANSELFTVGRDASLNHLMQAGGTGLWQAVEVKRVAGSEPDYVTQYKTEATLYDTGGCPEAGVAVTISSDEAVALWINAKSYQLEVGQPITVPTNAMGKLTVSTLAFGLHTPHLTFSAENLPPLPPVYAPQHVHDYLAGGGQLPGLGAMNSTNGPTTLQQAQVYTSRFPPQTKTLSPGLNANTAQAAVQAFNGGFSISVSSSAQAAQPAYAAVSNVAGKRALKLFATRDEMRAHLQAAGQAAPGDAYDDFWDELQQWGSDVYHAIKSGAMTVYQVSVYAEDNVVQIGLEIDGVGQRVLSFMVKTYHDLANLAHAVFVLIEVAVEEAIDWLKALFAWHDIANTQKVFEHYACQAIPYLQSVVQQSNQLLDGFFSNLESDITRQFDILSKTILNGQTMNQIASGPYSAARPAAAPRSIPGFDASAFLDGAKHNWLLEKALPALTGTLLTGIPSAPGVQTPLTGFITQLEKAVTDLNTAVGEVVSWFDDAVRQPLDFKSALVPDVLNAVRDMVIGCLKFADDVIGALMQLVIAVLEVAAETLTTPIDIPVVSSIYNKITGESITFLGCFALLAALPITVAYKTANGVNAQLFTDDMVSRITSMTAPGAALPAAALPGDVNGDIQAAVKYTGAALASIWALMDTALDANPDVTLTAFQMADIIFPISLQMFEWPGPLPLEGISMNTATQRWTFGNWLVGWVLPVVNIGMMVAADVGVKGKLVRYMDPAGKVFASGVGALSLALGATASGLGQQDGSLDGAAIAANVLGTMPNLFAFLRLESLEEISEGVLPATKLLIDFFTGEGTAVAMGAS